MVTIKKAKNRYKVIIFNPNNFFKLINDLKEVGFKGSKIEKDKKPHWEWIGNAFSVKQLIIRLKISKEPYTLEFDERELTPFPEQKRTGITFNPELLALPPLTGKPPFENFQIEDITTAIKYNRFAFFHGMGNGKSYLIINTLNHLIYNNKINKIVFVLPAEGILNMYRELFRFKSFELEDNEIYIVDTKNRKPFRDNIRVVFMTYQNFLMISNDSFLENKKKKSKGNYHTPQIKELEKWGNSRCIILDESHCIKNHTSKRSKILHLYKDYFEYRYIATGTPFPNSTLELFSQIKFLDENFVNFDYYQFVKWIANVGNYFSEYAVNYIYKEREAEFLKKIENYYIRRLDEALELPELLVKPVYVKLSDLQNEIYQETFKVVYSKYKESGESTELSGKRLVSFLPYLKLALEQPENLEKHFSEFNSFARLVKKYNFEKHSNKLSILKDMIEDSDDKEKIVIFSFHPLIIDKLAIIFKKYNPVIIHGEVEEKDKVVYRDKIINKFKKDDKCKLLIANPVMLQTSVTIIECRKIIYFDRDFNLTTWLQSIKRFHRAGQDKHVVIYPMIYERTIEESVHESLERKENLNRNLLKKGKVSIDFLKDLLKL